MQSAAGMVKTQAHSLSTSLQLSPAPTPSFMQKKEANCGEDLQIISGKDVQGFALTAKGTG